LWSGDVGLGTAGWMQQVFGTVGSFILLTLAALITLLLLINHDIQVTLDRAGEFVASLPGRTRDRWHAARAAHAERAETRAALLAERRAAREVKQRERIKREKERERGRAEETKRRRDDERKPVAPPSDDEVLDRVIAERRAPAKPPKPEPA